MSNHPNRILSQQRVAFLQAAIADGGRIFRCHMPLTHAPHWHAGVGEQCVRLRDASAQGLVAKGLIERIVQPGSANTARDHENRYLYRITEAGRAAVLWRDPPRTRA